MRYDQIFGILKTNFEVKGQDWVTKGQNFENRSS